MLEPTWRPRTTRAPIPVRECEPPATVLDKLCKALHDPDPGVRRVSSEDGCGTGGALAALREGARGDAAALAIQTKQLQASHAPGLLLVVQGT
jgi:hypothetical protein